MDWNHIAKKWNLQVNIYKTKIMVFRKGGLIRQNEMFTYAGDVIEIVNSFNYLGIVLSSGGSFVKATNTLVGKSLKANECIMGNYQTNASAGRCYV